MHPTWVSTISFLVFQISTFSTHSHAARLDSRHSTLSSHPPALESSSPPKASHPSDSTTPSFATENHTNLEDLSARSIVDRVDPEKLKKRNKKKGSCGRKSKKYRTRAKLEPAKAKDVTKIGDATYYGTGLGACGITSTDESMIAAASHLLFDSFPGATANPNMNPICGRKVRATYEGKSVEVQIVDRCTGCAMEDLDFSPTAFSKLGAMEKGRLHGMKWQWI